jgi:hypothetical protein
MGDRGMSQPGWYSKVKRHPDYNGDRVILVDTNVFSDMAIRGSDPLNWAGNNKWTDELIWVINCPPSELRIKLNRQLFDETLGGHAAGKMSASDYQKRREFIQIYRDKGKILLDDGAVPFFAPTDRLSNYDVVIAEFNRFQLTKAGKNELNQEDVPIVVDAIVNSIPLLTGDKDLAKGLDKRLGIPGSKDPVFQGDEGIKREIKARGLWELAQQVLLRDPRVT